MADSQIEAFRRYMATASDLSEGTRTRYAYEVGQFFKLVEGKGVDQLSARDILDWNSILQEGGASQGTVGQKRAALRQFFQYLEEFEQDEHAGRLLRAMNHLKMPTALAPRREPYALTEDQVQRLLDAAAERPGVGIRDRAIIHFLWATATRRAELRNLTLPDLDLEDRVASVVGKGDKRRNVVFDAACQEDLARWLEVRATWEIAPEVQEVFVSAFGRQLNINTVGNIVRECGERAGLRKELWTHIFRHSRLTGLLNGGMSIQDTAVFAGHSDPATTLGYFHQGAGELKSRYDRATGGTREGAIDDPKE
jgi:site-specific recombinase XerD